MFNLDFLLPLRPMIDQKEAISEKALISDLVYTPLETNLLKIAKNRKIRFVDGLGMLIHQGVPGFEAWFGKTPLITEDLRELLLQ